MNAKLAAVIQQLKEGKIVENYKEGGNSMVPLIYSKEPVTLEPVEHSKLAKGDIVLVKVKGRIYTHLITALRENMVQISNNKGHVNGWTKLENVFGIVTKVGDRVIGGAKNKVK